LNVSTISDFETPRVPNWERPFARKYWYFVKNPDFSDSAAAFFLQLWRKYWYFIALLNAPISFLHPGNGTLQACRRLKTKRSDFEIER